jgi:predicted RNase H-like HicB family nuclease
LRRIDFAVREAQTREKTSKGCTAPRRNVGSWSLWFCLLPGETVRGGSSRMKTAMVEIQPIRVEVEQEQDGRILASVPDLPGVMAYGVDEIEAIRKVKSIALQVLADMIESGEEVPEPLKVLFAA